MHVCIEHHLVHIRVKARPASFGRAKQLNGVRKPPGGPLLGSLASEAADAERDMALPRGAMPLEGCPPSDSWLEPCDTSTVRASHRFDLQHTKTDIAMTAVGTALSTCALGHIRIMM